MPKKPTNQQQFLAENAELRARLNEAEETLRAIRDGETDALVVSGPEGDKIIDLKGGQEPYRIMVEAMNDGAVTLAEDGTILYANRRFADWVKVPPGQIVGQPLQGMLAEQHRQGFDAMLVQGAKGSVRETLTLQATDGMQIPALFSMSPLPQSEGKAISVVIADLSEVIAGNEARSRLTLIVESSDDAIVSTSLDGLVESWNRAAEKLYGYTAGEAIGQPINDLIVPPERVSEMMHKLEAIRLGKRTLLEDTVRLRKDGTELDVSIKASPIHDASDKIIGASINSRDITERKQVKQERDRATYLLHERLKELDCLFTISTIIADSELPIEQRMQRIVETIPPAFQYPEITCARISLRGKQYRSADFRKTARRLASSIALDGEEDGVLEVFYTKKSLASNEGPFLREERVLVDTIARMVVDDLRLGQAMSQLRQFRDLLDDSSDIVLVADPVTACFIDVNARASSCLGYSRDELLGMKVMDIDAAVPSKSAWHNTVNAVKKAGTVLQEVNFRRKDGSTFPVEISGKYLSRAGNNYIVAIVRDITERKFAEDALRESEKEFHSLAESMPQIVWITRPDGWNIYFNQQWMDYTGLTFEESMGHGWNKPFHPDDQQRAWDAWQKATKNLDIYSIEARLRRADGEYRWWLVRGVPLQNADGNILKWFGTCTDIHDLKMAGLEITRTNNELRESERRFSDMLGNIELISLMLDHDSQITYCNDYLLRLTGWQREEVIGKDLGDIFIPPELIEYKNTVFAQLFNNQPEARHHENDIITRSGERRLIRWNNSVLRSENGELIGAASIGEDITERKQAETRIAQLNRVLSVLSSINTLIVHVNDREELFREACNIAIDAGGFRMAMIVIVDPDTMLPTSIASAGKDEKLLAAIKGVLSSSEVMQTKPLVAQAMKEKKSVIANDTQNDPRLLFGKQYAEAGVNSMLALPLIISGEAVGTLVLYASESDFFHEDEMTLLTELAGDIAYAIDHIDKQERLNYLAYYDVLTGLANRTLFFDRVAQYIQSAISGSHKLALGIIDLERFKNINDSLGRSAGDSLLKQASEWLTQFARNANLLARIDADHFAFVVPEVKSEGSLANLVENLMATFLEHSFDLNDASFRIGIKVGIALFPNDGDNVDIVFRNAEAALKKAKASGDRYLFYTQKMTSAVASKLALENQLRSAIDNEEFVLHYQPKVNLMSGKVTSAEALIRWNDPLTGLVPPGMFIPILEETGLIYEVGRWALHKAMSDYLRWRAAGLPAVRIAVNVSPLQLRNINFIDEIRQVVAVAAAAATGLELEITESLIMEDVEHSITSLQTVRVLGVTIAIDDFGTGFSSLSYLAKLPVDTLKIDRAFVIEMDKPEGMALVSTIIVMAHALKLKVVAEGVETEQQMRQLLSLNCDEMQGFLFSKPVPEDIFEANFLAPPALDEQT